MFFSIFTELLNEIFLLFLYNGRNVSLSWDKLKENWYKFHIKQQAKCLLLIATLKHIKLDEY